MEKANIIGLDLAKRSFQAHGAQIDGGVAFRRKLSRDKVLGFLALQPRCVVAMEACGSAHHWGRAIGDLGHEVRLIPPVYVKPFVKRQKNDAADAEAICEAASRPTMRFVAVKTEEQQSRAMLFRTRDLLVRQRTQLINALRDFVAWSLRSARWRRREINYATRTQMACPRSRIRLSDLTAIATSVARRASSRDFKISPITRL
jgi:transposase